MEDLTKEELQDLIDSYEDYVMNCKENGEEPYTIYEYYINEYEKPIPTLKGVGVKDTENGIKIVLMSTEDNVLGTYEIETNMSGYNDGDLFKVCYNISQKVNSLYYEEKGNLTQEQVLEIVRNELVK
jgi:hypothetical protein